MYRTQKRVKFIDLIDCIFDLIYMDVLSDEGCRCAEIISTLCCYTVMTVSTIIVMIVMIVMNQNYISSQAQLT